MREPVLIVSEEEYSIKEIMEIINEKMGGKMKIEFDKGDIKEVISRKCSNKKLVGLIKDVKFTPFKDGIQETYEWFLKNYDKIRN